MKISEAMQIPLFLCLIIKADSSTQHLKYCTIFPQETDREERWMMGKWNMNVAGSNLTNRMPEMPPGEGKK